MHFLPNQRKTTGGGRKLKKIKGIGGHKKGAKWEVTQRQGPFSGERGRARGKQEEAIRGSFFGWGERTWIYRLLFEKGTAWGEDVLILNGGLPEAFGEVIGCRSTNKNRGNGFI